jgi:membrane associated rhomboid family serine protease
MKLGILLPLIILIFYVLDVVFPASSVSFFKSFVGIFISALLLITRNKRIWRCLAIASLVLLILMEILIK